MDGSVLKIFWKDSVSISSPSNEGGGQNTRSFADLSQEFVSISSPSNEGGGRRCKNLKTQTQSLFPLVLLQTKVVGIRMWEVSIFDSEGFH